MTEKTLHDLAETVRRLAEAQERSRRRGWLLLAAGLFGGFLLGAGMGTPATAQGLLQRLETRVQHDEEKLKESFEARMLGMKKRLAEAKAESVDTAHMVAVILHDMKKALEAMPAMAEDMHQMNAKMSAVPAMAAEMHDMNMKMGIMAHGVDTTMGRMGRMVPWAPW